MIRSSEDGVGGEAFFLEVMTHEVTISYCCHRYILWVIFDVDMVDVIMTTFLGEVVLIDGKGENV